MNLLALRSTVVRRALRYAVRPNDWESSTEWKSVEELSQHWKTFMGGFHRMRMIRYEGNIFIIGISQIRRYYVFRFTDPFIGEIAYSQWRRYYGKQQNVNGQ